MKIFKITISLLAGLFLILCFSVFIFIKTLDVNQYKPQLVDKLSEAIGREVMLSKIGLEISLTKGLILSIEGLRAKDEPHFSDNTFLSVNSIVATIDFMRLLRKREIVIPNIIVKSPKLWIIRDKHGIFNIQTVTLKDLEKASVGSIKKEDKNPEPLPKPAQSEASSEPKNSPAAKSPSKKGSTNPAAPDLPPIYIKSVMIENGLFMFDDQLQDPKMQMDIPNINITVEDFSLDKAFDFSLGCSLFSTQENIKLDGIGQLELAKNQVSLENVRVTADLSSVVVSSLKEAIPQVFKNIKIGPGVQGYLKTTLQKVVIGPEGVLALSGEGTFSEGYVSFNELPFVASGIFLNYDITEKDFNLTDFLVRFGPGIVEGNGKVEDYLGQQNYSFEVSANDVSLGKLMAGIDPHVDFMGIMNMQGKVTGSGFGKEDLTESLSAAAQISIVEGKLLNVNILRVVLGRITVIPQLLNRIVDYLPTEYQTPFIRNDTIFDTVEIDLSIQEDGIKINKAEMLASEFSLVLEGSLDYQQNFVLSKTIFLSKEVSSQMLSGVEALAGLLEDDGRLRIPLRAYEGKLSNFDVLPNLMPDVRRLLSKRIIRKTGEQQIRKLLDKAFDREEETQPGTVESQPNNPSAPETTPPPEPQDRQKSLEEEIIENIFDRIFQE